MKNGLLIIALLTLSLGAKAGTFNMVEVNPNQGYCDNLFSDSSKYIYGAGDLKHFAKMNGLLYFVGTDQPYNDELWVTDGSQAGTHKIKDINANGGAHIGDLRVVGNKLMFLANETTTNQAPTDDYDLYVSDGTTAGTTKAGDLNLSFNTLLADQSAGVANGKLIFCTNTDVMVSDGTISGTKSLASINIVSYVGANGYCDMNGNVYFIVNSDIWKSDGTVAGTKPVKTLADSATSHWTLAFASFIKAFDNKLYIVGALSGQGDDLWSFDGTENGAVTKVLSTPGGNTYPAFLTICAGSLWFTAYDTLSYSLYKLSPSSSPQRISSSVGTMSFSNNKLYYPNADNNGFNVIDAVTGVQSSFSKSSLSLGGLGFSVNPNSVISMGNKVFYTAYDSATGQQVMCITDGTSAGIKVEMPAGVTVAHPFDYTPSCGLIDNFDFTYYDNKIVIPANFNNAGRELWFYSEDGLVNGIKETEDGVMALYPNPASDLVSIDLGMNVAIDAEMSIQVLDINGRLVSENKVEGSKALVATKAIANGSYIVAVNKGGESIARRKLIVAH
ncbi:MAG: hypothetical protein JWO03_1555 [Bacteroidetes bacterium]|nr:hypothetical protein [Bacteroidota bacterium]